ncbi:hypothetical protein [Adhaeribacter pallidiroseus]|uniref:Uncharacterized protein n=1 Tax=Adhaeribacter pallidiroseus TaxID=2072847 RepID=A0A369QLF3_9BACT|nr:hypothetical protein [Adhaeribacter pallidiroseus]RDC65763.1 hypothetical protein AHMF7616_04393 [Adhaeribacter pallidiroseus]
MKNILHLFIGFSLFIISYNDNSTKKVEEEKPAFDAFATTIKADSAESDAIINNTKPQKGGIEIPNELKSFVGKGQVTYALERGDINADGSSDYLLSIGKPLPKDEDGNLDYEVIEASEEKLNVLLIIRDRNKMLSLKASNNNILDYPISTLHEPDGIYPDSIGTGFLISYFGSGEGVRSSYTREDFFFTFSKHDNQWYLSKIIDETGLNSPGAALNVDIEDFKEEHPNYTENQIDSIEELPEEYSKATITIYTSKDFVRRVAFSSFNYDDYYSGKLIINKE